MPNDASEDAYFATQHVGPHNSRRPDGVRGTVQEGSSEVLKIRRRNRQITSCFECRRRKLKCDKQSPCGNCTNTRRDCQYLAPVRDARSQRKLTEMKDRMSALEDDLRDDSNGSIQVAGTRELNVTSDPTAFEQLAETGSASEVDETPCDRVPLESTPLATLDNVYDDNADDEFMDVGVQLGKLRISERIGGWIRSKLADELNETLQHMGMQVGESFVDSRVLPDGPAPNRTWVKSYIGPGSDYIAPASSLFFPAVHTNTSPLDHLPLKPVADLLIARYADAVHPIARAVHWPTFKTQYANFWSSITSRVIPNPSTQAVVFAAMFSAAVSMHEATFLESIGANKFSFVENLRAGTELALSTANFLRTTRLDTMQAFVMYLIPLVRSEVSRAHSALVGTAIRLAQCMGLHRDGSHYSMSAVELQVRRILWHQLCFLDMRACEATGPSLQIRHDEHDTHFPLNVNDHDFLSTTGPPKEDKRNWTDMTLFRIHTELTAIRRSIWADMALIDRRQKCLTKVLVKLQRICQKIESVYGSMITAATPTEQMARCVLDIGKSGWFVQILHRYITNTTQPMPDRLRQVLIDSGIRQMENAILIDTKTELNLWSWYRGAINQYHAAILLIREVSVHPLREDSDRIWKCLDYIFDIPPNLSAEEKSRDVMTELRDRMAMFHDMRKIKLTARLEERVAFISRSTLTASRRSEFDTHASDMHDPSTSSRVNLGESAVAVNNNNNSVLAAASQENSVDRPVNHLFYADQFGGDDDGRDIVEAGADSWNIGEDIDWSEWDQYFPFHQNLEG